MTQHPISVQHDGWPCAVVAETSTFGLRSYELIGLPRRLFDARATTPALHETGIDARQVETSATPAELLLKLPNGDNWNAMAVRSQARLLAAFLIAEDPQRRLEARKAETLMHQASLVAHILSTAHLRRVLIADEVGLGKTIEAGLIIQRVLADQPSARVLYLAPARLVENVAAEFREKLDLDARRWVAGPSSDARLAGDRLVIASIHKAVTLANQKSVLASGPWQVIVVDECHHLSDWAPGGGDPNRGYRLVERLVEGLAPDGRLILMSGTPHQGNQARFGNILRLLQAPEETLEDVGGRVIFRIKDRVRDWQGRPLFPKRDVRPPRIVHLGPHYEAWYRATAALYETAAVDSPVTRATGWARGQALQWVASSPEAGLGFLVRLAIRRLGWTCDHPALGSALPALRPYRGGPPDEPIDRLYDRLVRQVGPGRQLEAEEEPDDADAADDSQAWQPDPDALARLLRQGAGLVSSPVAQAKWEKVAEIIDQIGNEKVVLFAQPVETVSVVARFLREHYGSEPAIIVGQQGDQERRAQVTAFRRADGPRFLVSSRAGGEGLNMQCARHLIHLDVPWNPMEIEQRIGRVHRFGSRRTIIVETVVAAETREVDTYRIARRKLNLIVRNLDAEHFEELFNRVMALIPPQELETVIGGATGDDLDASIGSEIERLVRQGYEVWSEFNETYGEQEERIRALDPGAADWPDLQRFLVEVCGATPAEDVARQVFRLAGQEVEESEEASSAVSLNGRLYVCGGEGGLIIAPPGGASPVLAGTNLPEVVTPLREAFIGDRLPSGAAYLRVESDIVARLGASIPCGVLALLRQTVRQERGRVTEVNTGLLLYLVPPGQSLIEVPASSSAEFLRLLVQARRQRDPRPSELLDEMLRVERELWDRLRYPTNDEIGLGIRHGVWPLFAAILS